MSFLYNFLPLSVLFKCENDFWSLTNFAIDNIYFLHVINQSAQTNGFKDIFRPEIIALRRKKNCWKMECLKTEVAINFSTNLHSDYRSDHFIIFTQPRLLKISNTWEKRFDHLLEMGGRRFRVILFRRRAGVSIPCKEMIGVKRFLPVLIYRQISRDCILNQQPHWIVYHFLAGSLSSKFQSLKIWFHLDTSKLENIISNLFCSPHVGCAGVRKMSLKC